jgi:hypothetical protein
VRTDDHIIIVVMNPSAKTNYMIAPSSVKQPGRHFKSVDPSEVMSPGRSSKSSHWSQYQPDAFDLFVNGYSGSYYKERGMQPRVFVSEKCVGGLGEKFAGGSG